MSFAELKQVENTWLSSYFDEFEIFRDPEVVSGIEHRTDYKNSNVYFTFKGETYPAFAVETGKELAYHYKMEGFSDTIFDNTSEKRIMVSENLADKYHIILGDELVIDGTTWIVDSIVVSEYFRNKIIFPENSGIKQQDGYSSSDTIIHFDKEFLSTRPDVLEILEGPKFKSLKRSETYAMKNLRSYSLFLISFAAIFITLSILNCYLVFYANFSYKRKMFGIKKTYGASSSACFGDIFLENILFSLLAYHIACFLVHIFRFNVPAFFYTKITLQVYGIGIAVVFIITVLYSLSIFRKINKLSTITLLKE